MLFLTSLIFGFPLESDWGVGLSVNHSPRMHGGTTVSLPMCVCVCTHIGGRFRGKMCHPFSSIYSEWRSVQDSMELQTMAALVTARFRGICVIKFPQMKAWTRWMCCGEREKQREMEKKKKESIWRRRRQEKSAGRQLHLNLNKDLTFSFMSKRDT